MRWENLFDDLEGQWETARLAEERDQRAEEERTRVARTVLRDRLRALTSADQARPLRLSLSDGTWIDLRAKVLGRDWMSGELTVPGDAPSREERACILPLASIHVLALDREQVRASLAPVSELPPERGIVDRIGLSFVLRDLCRRRARVELRLRDAVVGGTLDRVARDHVDVAVHEVGTPRRESLVSGYRLVPLAGIVLVRV
ncbi:MULTISPECIES: hypothetical protein [Clavibacter]|uniref:Uncharacterized protein n=2 Tax=Clavibacter TaxID=1573 RepID=A0A399NW02_9MICO|nr:MULTISPECIES: hypothetical protein [Clavibacter]KDP90734.1 hypothetical protein W824_14755 [Clavibacter cf. michiganensis LMG 26808]RII98352.1 hypothetical protein DZF96_03490 [Clavibacter michiganensis]UKF26152.1 hypothetical protein KYT88_05475 [Clavibacter sp. A6099]